MANVLYMNSSNELYGADRSLLRLVTSLDKNYFRPYVFLPNDLPYEGLLSNEFDKIGIPYQKFPLAVLRRKYFNISGLISLLYRALISSAYLYRFSQKQDMHLIHSNTSAVLTGAFASQLLRIPHIWHVREIMIDHNWLGRFVAGYLYLFANKVVAVSGPVKDSLVAALPHLERKIVVIHNGIDITPFQRSDHAKVFQLRQEWVGDEDVPIVGMIGRISSRKGQDYLARAIAKITPSYPNIRVVFVGGYLPGEEWRKADLYKFISNQGIQNQVRIEDFRQDIDLVLSAFDIVVVPSILPEAFPTTVLEAMAAGKPVIATAHGGVIEQIENGITGLLVSPKDPCDMSSAIEHLISNRDDRLRMGQAGRERVLRNFTVERYVNDIQSLYSNTLIEFQSKRGFFKPHRS